MIRINDRLTCRSARVDRYKRLLATNLTEIERRYIERRLAEERAATLPIVSPSGPAARQPSGVQAAYPPDMR